MRILRIHINNLNSLKLQTTISFVEGYLSEADIFAITGDTGAGKTTILDAITLALYGRVARDRDAHKEVMSYGAVECQAEVEFAIGDARYLASWRMHRARHKVDGKLSAPQRELALWDDDKQAFIPIAEKIREVDDAVRRITKLDFERFTRSVMLAQGDFAAFLEANDKERSDLLERITGTRIYSQLSTAAFERYRQEEQWLKELQEQQGQLLLLAIEKVTEEQLTATRDTTQHLRNTLERTQQAVQKLEQWLKTEARVKRLTSELDQLQEEKNAFAEQSARLARSKLLNPYRSLFQTWDLQVNQQQQLTIAAQALSVQLTDTTKQYQQQEKRTETAAESFQVTRIAAKEEESRIQQAAAREEEHRQLKTQWTALNKELDILRHEQAIQQKTLQACELALKTQRAERENIQDWLITHELYLDLPKRYPVIQQERQQLHARYRSWDKLNKRKTQLEATVLEWEEKTKTQELAHEQQQKILQKLQDQFERLLPEPFSSNEDAGIERLSAAILDLQEKRAILQQLVRLDEAYQKSLQEQEQYSNQLSDLLGQQQYFNKELLSLLELHEGYQYDLDYRRAIYEQQQLIVNYEKDRQNLRPGDPCPLCQATEHPFHHHPVRPFVDRAKAELATAEANLQEVLTKEKELLLQEAQLNQQIELLYGESEQSNIRLLQARILTYEDQIAGLLETQIQDQWRQERGPRLVQHLTKLDQQLAHWRTLQTQLTQLNQQVNKITTNSQDAERQYIQYREQLGVARAEAKATRITLQEEQTLYEAALQAVNQQLLPFGKTFNLSTAKETFAYLEEMADAVQKKIERQQTLLQQIELDHSQQQSQSNHLKKLDQQVQEKAEKLAELARGLDNAESARQALIGDKSVAEARQLLEKNLINAEQTLRVAQQQQQAQKELLLTQQERMAENEKQQATTKHTLDEVQVQLNLIIEQAGFSSLDTARSALLPEQEQAELEAEQQRLLQAVLQTQKTLVTAQEESINLKPEEQSEVEQNVLRQKLHDQQIAYEQQLVQTGQLEEKFKQQKAQEKRHEELIRQVKKQRKSYNRWAQLNEIIGQKDGKKFRSFAQGLTLQRLIILANQHLDRLSGRYYIAKKEGTDLELDIIDTFQAENRRSMFTLSGGETFLISLALALGLSDLAGRHAQIQSLFIDEGFGTLDDHSLDMAISTLENLRSGGKTIGIISHVKALKERIGTQIQLNKQSDGFSKVTIRA